MAISYNLFTGNFEGGTSLTKNEIHFVGKGRFFIEVKDEEVRFELTYPLNGTRSFKISQENFSKPEILSLSKRFNLGLGFNPYSKRLTTSIKGLSENYGYAVYGAEVNINDNVFLCVYAKRGESAFVENIYFIQGIYKINKSLLSD